MLHVCDSILRHQSFSVWVAALCENLKFKIEKLQQTIHVTTHLLNQL